MSAEVGTIDFKIDNSLCYLWQYDDANKLKSLMDKKNKFIENSVEKFFRDYFSNIFNIKTANNFGLELWGVLLGVPRPQYTNANSEVVNFTDDMYRKLLLAKVLKFNINGSVAEINDYLRFMFDDPEKVVFLKNNYDMTVEVIFHYKASLEDMAVINSEDFLPLPTGVKVVYAEINTEEIFGFEGSGLTGFDHGTFIY